jgi:menaquinone-dependent protoporphyrinogen oxidase
MKTVILYDTKHGFTKEVAYFIEDSIEDASLFPLNEAFDLNEYDVVYLGSYIYKGKLSKNTIKFITKNKNILMGKKIKLFCSALDSGDFYNAIQTSLDPEIFYRSKKVNTGGKVVMKNLRGYEKRLLKRRINVTDDTATFNKEKVLEFIKDNKW